MARRFRKNTGAQEQGAQQAPASSNVAYVVSHLNRGLIFNLPDGKKVRLAGLNDNLRGQPKGVLAVGGGVYTKISADEWEYISKTYSDFAPILNGLIYAEASAGAAKAAARERQELRSGFEPVDPAKTRTQADKAN